MRILIYTEARFQPLAELTVFFIYFYGYVASSKIISENEFLKEISVINVMIKEYTRADADAIEIKLNILFDFLYTTRSPLNHSFVCDRLNDSQWNAETR